MTRKAILRSHIAATAVALLTIGSFFTLSLLAELIGDHAFIRQVKTGILYGVPVLLIAMPTLGVTGSKLAGKSTHPLVLTKMRRMKVVAFNGCILIGLAIYLYFRAVHYSIDGTFLFFQVLELLFGATNLTLIVLNARAGMKLSGQKLGKTAVPG
ncbi:hypothetical protein [Lewinella sp. IMCC34183]|uniref:hypothetical protein n=1 Tax=Lewinella sp. IMCC34183 TaxID=2248762 RepID=UPI000E263259|nr:hypothetical protein [Lewinella sp. IMCC34183]